MLSAVAIACSSCTTTVSALAVAETLLHCVLVTEALLFIKELIAESKKQHMVWHDKEYVNMVYRNIAIAVARGNTTIVKSNLAKTEQELQGRRRRA